MEENNLYLTEPPSYKRIPRKMKKELRKQHKTFSANHLVLLVIVKKWMNREREIIKKRL